jgi:acyl-CoA dehydrogenase family protein 9
MGDGHKKFLSDFYLKQFDHIVFESFVAVGPDPKAAGIIAGFHQLAEEFPAAALEKSGAIPAALWQGLREIGIFGLNIPTEYGGVGLSPTQYLKVLQEMAGIDMALALIPTAHLSIGTKGIVLYGSEAQKEKYLPKAASGDMLFAYALTEPDIGSDARHIATTAVLSKDGSHYLLNGHKIYITNGGYAGALMVFAQLNPGKPGRMGAFIVETGSEGVKIGNNLSKMGLAISSTTAITFEDVRVPVENLVGEPGDGFKIAMTILNYGRLGLGAASSGVMNIAGSEMLKRAGNRKQFNKPIKEFELIQDKIVRARVHAAVCEAMTNFTAHLLEREPLANVAIESSHTKLFGTTRAWDTLYDAQQTAGGAGYLTGLPCEKRLRDFRVTTIFEGTTEIHAIYPPLLLVKDLTSIHNHKKDKGSGFGGWLSDLLHHPSFGLHPRKRRCARAPSSRSTTPD